MSMNLRFMNIEAIWVVETEQNIISIPANSGNNMEITVPGGRVEDFVASARIDVRDAGLGISHARVTADDTMEIEFVNTTGSAINPATVETIRLLVVRPDKTFTDGVPT